jgi:hypothetical protein
LVVRVAAAALAAGALAGCGNGSGDLTGLQQRFLVKACMSLIERHVANDSTSITIDGHKLSLADPQQFYRVLQELRAPSVFLLDNDTSLRYGPHSELSDLCKDKASAPPTTVPGSG